MTFNYEDAFRLKAMEMAQECCTDDNSPNEYCTRMTLDLFHRRKTMLVWFFAGRLDRAAIKEIARLFECTEKALIDDWVDRKKWEPFIWESVKASDKGEELLKLLQLARETALYMMQTSRSPNARVGAIGRFTEAIKVEIELRQSLGLLPKQISPAVVIQQNTEVIVEYEGEQAGLHIGKFCSIADDVKILLGGEHNYRLGSTYSFDNLLIRFKELGPSVKTKRRYPHRQ